MQLRRITTILFLATFSLKAHSQSKDLNLILITKYTNNCINTSLIKDSTALYTCNLRISVEQKNSYQPIIESNDTANHKAIVGLNALKNFDFKPFMGNEKRVKFVIPISVIVLDSSYNPKKIDAHLMDRIDKLFYYSAKDEKMKIIYVPAVNMMIDKKVYN